MLCLLVWHDTFFILSTTKQTQKFYRLFCRWAHLKIRLLSLVFPFGCRNYFPPHTLDCVKSVWADVGCLKELFDPRVFLTLSVQVDVNQLDLRYVLILAV